MTSISDPRPASDYRPRPSVETQLALEWACKRGTAHQRLYGERNLVDQLLDAVRTFRALGKEERLAHLVGPLVAELEHGPALPLSNALIREAVRADSVEDIARAQYLLQRCDTSRRAWLRCIAAEQASKLRLIPGLRGVT